MNHRIFIAADVPDKIQEEIIKLRNEIYINNNLSWEKKEKLHFTLKFLGETDENLIPKFSEAIKKVAAGFSPFGIRFSNFGFFNKLGKPSVLWLGIEESIELNNLFDNIENSMAEIGFEKEKKKFHAHLTLLRIKNYLKELKKFDKKPADFLSFSCNSISLVKSELFKSGSVYTTLNKYNFKEG